MPNVKISEIRPELSAQGVRKRPNPMLDRAWAAAASLDRFHGANPLLVDYGCGQLRNVAVILKYSDNLMLVDTPQQLDTPHEFFGRRMLANEFASEQWPHSKLRFLSSVKFERSHVSADAIFVVNVFDVVPTATRITMVKALLRNLRRDGLAIVIAPRNDSWTLRICTLGRSYEHGFVFPHPGGYTYYRNWISDSLNRWLECQGLRVLRDLSCYRQVCLIVEKHRRGNTYCERSLRVNAR